MLIKNFSQNDRYVLGKQTYVMLHNGREGNKDLYERLHVFSADLKDEIKDEKIKKKLFGLYCRRSKNLKESSMQNYLYIQFRKKIYKLEGLGLSQFDVNNHLETLIKGLQYKKNNQVENKQIA